MLGWNNVLDAGPGTNFLNGLQSGDVFRLNAAGQGLDTISGFSLTNGDKIDVGRALSGLNVASDLSNVGNFLTATSAAPIRSYRSIPLALPAASVSLPG